MGRFRLDRRRRIGILGIGGVASKAITKGILDDRAATVYRK
jgi:hypothetical protein